MKEQEYKEICLQIKKTEQCLKNFKKILDSSKIEREFGNPYPNGEPSYNHIIERRRQIGKLLKNGEFTTTVGEK